MFFDSQSGKGNGTSWFEPSWGLENSKTRLIGCSSLETWKGPAKENTVKGCNEEEFVESATHRTLKSCYCRSRESVQSPGHLSDENPWSSHWENLVRASAMAETVCSVLCFVLRPNNASKLRGWETYPADSWEQPSGAGWIEDVSRAIHCTICSKTHGSHSLPGPSRCSLSLSHVTMEVPGCRCSFQEATTVFHVSSSQKPVQRYAGKLNFQVLVEPSTCG